MIADLRLGLEEGWDTDTIFDLFKTANAAESQEGWDYLIDWMRHNHILYTFVRPNYPRNLWPFRLRAFDTSSQALRTVETIHLSTMITTNDRFEERVIAEIPLRPFVDASLEWINEVRVAAGGQPLIGVDLLDPLMQGAGSGVNPSSNNVYALQKVRNPHAAWSHIHAYGLFLPGIRKYPRIDASLVTFLA